MNYAAHYDRLIARARCRCLTGYRERHHVLPRCMGGGDEAENLVDLTPEEHYVAHQLLVKIHPTNYKVGLAILVMSRQGTGNRLYGWLRRRLSGLPRSQEHKAKIAAALRGRPKSLETRAKLSAKLKGRKLTDEHRANIAACMIGQQRALGRKQSPEERAMRSTRLTGIPKKPRNAEHAAKLAAANRGNKHHLGKRHSDESKRRMSMSRLAYFYRRDHPYHGPGFEDMP